MNIKDMVSNGKKVTFVRYKQKELWYVTECGFEFPVPVDDTGDGTFLAEDKAMMFMRYIRKHIANIEAGKQEQAAMIKTRSRPKHAVNDMCDEYWDFRDQHGAQEAHDLFM